MIEEIGLPEVMASLGCVAILLLCAYMVFWFGYCISSIARAADALERIADVLEDEDAEEEGGAK